MLIRLGGIAILSYLLSAALASPEQVILGHGDMASFERPEGSLPTLADLLTLETRGSIFYSYAREVNLSSRFSQSDPNGTTVFVPTNKAVMALSRKPHEDTVGVESELSEADYYATSLANVQRWVGAHIIPSADVDFSTHKPYDTLTEGITITFKHITGAYHPPGEPKIDTDAAHFASVKGSSKVDTDAAHFASVKGPAPKAKAVEETPEWKEYEINDGVYMIERRQASNGVLYLINKTILV